MEKRNPDWFKVIAHCLLIWLPSHCLHLTWRNDIDPFICSWPEPHLGKYEAAEMLRQALTAMCISWRVGPTALGLGGLPSSQYIPYRCCYCIKLYDKKGKRITKRQQLENLKAYKIAEKAANLSATSPPKVELSTRTLIWAELSPKVQWKHAKSCCSHSC